jgi:hypothetical protein
MKTKLSEDWISVLIGFAVILVAVLGLLQPDWFKF